MAIVIASVVIGKKLSTSSKSHVIELALKNIRTSIDQNMSVKVHSKDEFISAYKAGHMDPSKMGAILASMTHQLQKGEEKEVCGWAREVEEQLHQDPKERYNCVLANFGGDHPLTAVVVEPMDGWWTKLMDSCLSCLRRNRKLERAIAESQKAKKKVPPRILVLFVLLNMHLFDYIKDIGKSS